MLPNIERVARACATLWPTPTLAGSKCATEPQAKAGAVMVIAGPTASGKSALALALAQQHDGVVINADSMQIYRELAILTARPDSDALRAAPHRLYGVLPATESCSAARWRTLALAEIAHATSTGCRPIVVGGTGLYLRALLEGLAPIPAVPPETRARARARLDALGAMALHAELALIDPMTAARLQPGDSQRIVRAWEVLHATGRPLAAWQADAPDGPPPGMRFAVIVLDPPRSKLYEACNGRFGAMIRGGALDEVRALDALDLDPATPILKALGVPELRRYLAHTLTLPEAVALGEQSTRRYAKRQVTWLRHQVIERPQMPVAAIVLPDRWTDLHR